MWYGKQKKTEKKKKGHKNQEKSKKGTTEKQGRTEQNTKETKRRRNKQEETRDKKQKDKRHEDPQDFFLGGKFCKTTQRNIGLWVILQRAMAGKVRKMLLVVSSQYGREQCADSDRWRDMVLLPSRSGVKIEKEQDRYETSCAEKERWEGGGKEGKE